MSVFDMSFGSQAPCNSKLVHVPFGIKTPVVLAVLPMMTWALPLLDLIFATVMSKRKGVVRQGAWAWLDDKEDVDKENYGRTDVARVLPFVQKLNN